MHGLVGKLTSIAAPANFSNTCSGGSFLKAKASDDVALLAEKREDDKAVSEVLEEAILIPVVSFDGDSRGFDDQFLTNLSKTTCRIRT